MKAVILAGGKGTRLRPLTYAVPKPLLPINEKPMMEHIILHMKNHGITEFIISVGYLGYQIKNYFNDGSELGVKIEYITEETPLGTAGCLNLIKDKLTETFLLIGGDNLTNLNFTKFTEFHKKHDGILSVALFELRQKVEYGVYSLDEDKKITKFEEKPEFKFNAGTMIFCLEPEIFNFIPEINKDHQEPINITDHILPKLIESKKHIYGYPFCDYWIDVGRLSDYDKVNGGILYESMKNEKRS
ncbi:MAG: nucleotidyltransferase family protein [DPANN group archaeon]|nr:nucleotidyltransferase family protein [DPANN group archaeon]